MIKEKEKQARAAAEEETEEEEVKTIEDGAEEPASSSDSEPEDKSQFISCALNVSLS